MLPMTDMDEPEVVLSIACRENSSDAVASSLESPNSKSFINNQVAAGKIPLVPLGVNYVTALHVAAVFSSLEIVKRLVKAGADVKVTDGYNETPLHLACVHTIDTVPKVTFLLSCDSSAIHVKTKEQLQPLHYAGLYGNDAVISTLVEYGAKVNEAGLYGFTAVHWAAYSGHHPCIVELIEHKADISIKDDQGNLPLHIASEWGKVDCATFFIDNFNCDINAKTYFGNTPLHRAAFGGHTNMIKKLCSYSACKINAANLNGDTALHIAAEEGHTQCIEELVNRKGDGNIKNNYGQLAFHLVCRKGALDTVVLFIDTYSCDINTTDHNGWTPVHYAAFGGHLEVIQKLTSSHSCNVSAIDNNGCSALHIAATHGKTDCVTCLIEKHDCDINNQDKNGQTALHKATIEGHLEVVQELASHRSCNFIITDNVGKTALNYAKEKKQENLIQVLEHKYLMNNILRDYDELQRRQEVVFQRRVWLPVSNDEAVLRDVPGKKQMLLQQGKQGGKPGNTTVTELYQQSTMNTNYSTEVHHSKNAGQSQNVQEGSGNAEDAQQSPGISPGDIISATGCIVT